LKEYVNIIKDEDKDYDFKGFVFIGIINFREDLSIAFLKYANFGRATFRGSVNFGKVTFKGHANFRKTTFKKYADFGKATFKEHANFKEATFDGSAGFEEAIFEVYADFRKATFKRHINFRKATFKRHTEFIEAIFEGQTDFRKAIFEGSANFGKATFEDDADFRLKYFARVIHFLRIKVFSGKKLFIRLNNQGGKISFERAYLENVYLNVELNEGVLIDFTNTLLRNTQIKKDQIENHLLHEKKKKFSQAKEIFLLLKNNFHSIGRYDDESWAYKKEKDMERLSQSFPYYKATLKNENKKESFPIIKWVQKGNFKKWITSAFSNMIYGYGEKPWNVIKTAVAIILIFALSFSFIGLGNPEIIELKGTAIHQNSGKVIDLTSKGFLKNNLIRNFPDSLYFSLITFTTLGYGDFRPLEGIGRILAGSEAFIGAIMMALFVYTFARRTGGR